jgi:hypothetical protein
VTIVCRLAFAIVLTGLAGGVPGFTRAQTGPSISPFANGVTGPELQTILSKAGLNTILVADSVAIR